jgi:hypothetical protein
MHTKQGKKTSAAVNAARSSPPPSTPSRAIVATPTAVVAVPKTTNEAKEKRSRYPYRLDILTNNEFTDTLAVLEGKLTENAKEDFARVHDLVGTSLQLMAADIYPEDAKSAVAPAKARKTQLLDTVCKRTDVFLNGHPTIEEITTLLSLLAANNLEYYYDYPWLHQEKCGLFLPRVRKLSELLMARLARPGDFSADTISKAIATLTAWNMSLPEGLIERLLTVAEELHQKKTTFSPQQAFWIFEGLSKIHHPANPGNQAKRTSLFVTLANTALPLLLKDEPPLKMFESRRLPLFRTGYVERLLPPLYDTVVLRDEILPRLMRLSRTTGQPVAIDDVVAQLPPKLVPNKTVILALRRKQAEAMEVGRAEMEEEAAWRESHNYNRYPLKTLQRHIQVIYKENNPRGLVHVIKVFANNLLSDIQHREKWQKEIPNAPGLMKYHPADVKDFLKTIRNYALAMVVPHITDAITRLCTQAVMPYNLAIIDNDLAITLLWINMVFAVLTDDPRMAFSSEHKAALFNKVTEVRTEEQGRDLFELKTFQWRGCTLGPDLEKQMQAKFAGFAKSANPSSIEQKYYAYIRKLLPSSHQRYLTCNHICTITGMEIDIVYREGKDCIAININGPFHYHPLMGSPTLKTSFRDKCLAKAGWKSFDVNLILQQSKAEALKNIVAELQRVIGQEIKLPHHPKRIPRPRPFYAKREDAKKDKASAKLQYPPTAGVLSTIGDPDLWQFAACNSQPKVKLFR